jgi:hypothetical protein
MKSKKIERHQKLIEGYKRELADLSEMDMPAYDREIKSSVLNELIAHSEKVIKATRNRNLWARERHEAMASLGLVRVRSITGKVYYE